MDTTHIFVRAAAAGFTVKPNACRFFFPYAGFDGCLGQTKGQGVWGSQGGSRESIKSSATATT